MISKYKDLSDSDLMVLIADGDKNALAYLLTDRYKGSLKAVFAGQRIDEHDFDEYVNEFYCHLITLNKDNQWRLRNIKKDEKPGPYFARAFKNFIIDGYRDAEPIVEGDFDERRQTDLDKEENTESEADRHRDKVILELKYRVFLEALDYISNIGARDRYILLTNLLGSRFHEKKPLLLSRRIAEQLNIPEATAYNANDRALARLNQFAKERLKQLMKGQELF